MFRCQGCGEVKGPRVESYLRTISTRDTSYSNVNSEGDPIHTVGSEIVSEVTLCAECAGVRGSSFQEGVDLKEIAPLDLAGIRGIADSRHHHARGCKSDPSTCRVCKFNVAWFNSLNPEHLSLVLNEGKFKVKKAA